MHFMDALLDVLVVVPLFPELQLCCDSLVPICMCMLGVHVWYCGAEFQLKHWPLSEAGPCTLEQCSLFPVLTGWCIQGACVFWVLSLDTLCLL
jgi:hypothetical protein